jgi:hypothetical protein
MALIDKHFKEKGFSKQTRKLLQASWRKGTQKRSHSGNKTTSGGLELKTPLIRRVI